ncbi:MAG: electron transport complex subunit RsxG [Lysobacterales bacterium]
MKSANGTFGLRAGLTLGAVTGLCISLVVGLAKLTEKPVAESQRRAALAQISEILPPDLYDNDPLDDVVLINAPEALGGTAQKVHRAFLKNSPSALVMQVRTLEGYAGQIDLLVAVRATGEVLGVRVTYHRETPGLGDAIEVRLSNWIRSFDGKSLGSPEPELWQVKRDGGEFDQFTAATITPRAVVDAVRDALVYFEQNKQTLFAQKRVNTALENNNE